MLHSFFKLQCPTARVDVFVLLRLLTKVLRLSKFLIILLQGNNEKYITAAEAKFPTLSVYK